MADFTIEPSGVWGSNVSPESPVANTGSAAMLSGLAGLAQGLGRGYAASTESRAKLEAQKRKGGALTEYTNKLSDWAQQMEDENLSTSEGETRARALLKEAKTKFPEYAAEMQDAYNSFIKGPMGSVISSGSEQIQTEDKLIGSAREAGWIKSWYTREQQVDAANQYAAFQQNGDLFDKESKLIARENANLDRMIKEQRLDTGRISQAKAQIELNNARLQRDAKTKLQSLGDLHFRGKFSSEMEAAKKLAKRGDPESMSQANQIIADALAEVEAVMPSEGAHAGNEFINVELTKFRKLAEITTKVVNGTFDQDAFKQHKNQLMLESTYLALQDEDIRGLATLNPLIGAANITTLAQEKASLKFIKRGAANTNPNPEEPSERKAFGAFTEGLLVPNMQKVLDGNAGDKVGEIESAVRDQLDDILKGVEYHKSAAQNPSQYDKVTEFLSSPTYTRWVEKYGRDPSYAPAAAAVIGVNWESKLIPAIRDQYDQATFKSYNPTGMIATKEDRENWREPFKPIKDYVEPVFAGNAVSFRLKGKAPKNAEVGKMLARLNSSAGLAGAVNRILNLNYNLSGWDRKQFWEERIAPEAFGISFEEEPKK